MSIKDDALEFHRSIWDFPNREEIKSVVLKLKSGARGYGEMIYPVPILGLLVYNQELIRKVEGRAPVDQLSSWSTRELKVLFGIHEQIRLFNQRCLAPLNAELPQCIDAANPYKKYPVTNNESEEFFFKSHAAEKVIQSFHTHPAFGVLLSTAVAVRGLPVNYEQTALELDMEIAGAGLGETSEWLARFDNARRWGTDDHIKFRHAGGLVCLYNALANLDELIYLGLFQDKLMHFDRSNIIDFVWTTGGAGPSMWFLHIPDWSMFICEPTDLITVEVDRPGQEGGLGIRLCQIASQTLSVSFSHPATLKVRMIDDNLSAYPYLLR